MYIISVSTLMVKGMDCVTSLNDHFLIEFVCSFLRLKYTCLNRILLYHVSQPTGRGRVGVVVGFVCFVCLFVI